VYTFEAIGEHGWVVRAAKFITFGGLGWEDLIGFVS
jgi:hypothetical protein